MFRLQRGLRPLILGILAILIIVEITFLSPTNIEERKPHNQAVDPQVFMQDQEPTIAPGLPKGRIAEYHIEKFRYVSVHNGIRQWKIDSDKANLYNPEKLVHSRVVTANLYDSDGNITVITGAEAKYFLNQRDLEIFGNVKTVFPDGFELYSDYLRYRPNEQKIIIPNHYYVHGFGNAGSNQKFQFSSQGLVDDLKNGLVELPEAVKVNFEKTSSGSSAGVREKTLIESDHCFIYRDQNLAKFTMRPDRPLDSRFVHMTQPTLFSRSRRADLHYGNFDEVLQYMIAYEDVLLKETDPDKPPGTLRYSTSGKAEFDNRKDLIVLSEFPQVYENEDTVVGDVITIHRDTDVVEVDHSNAFRAGS